MKEFAIRHPFICLMAVCVVSECITNVAKIIGITRVTKSSIIVSGCACDEENVIKEDTNNESSGDIQNSDESDK